MSEPLRISKYLSECGVLSRRASDEAIKDGKVTVNGRVAQIGEKIDPDTDEVCYEGKKVVSGGRKIYIMMNKPVGYVTTLKDEKGRKCVTELLTGLYDRVYPIGRLDIMSEGLLLFTNDGELANKVMHPRYNKEKVYELKVSRTVRNEIIEAMKKPFVMDGYTTMPAEVKKIGSDDRSTTLQITIHEGRNREIRNICEMVGLKIVTLKRVSEDGLQLGDLKTGSWRYLKPSEVEMLRKNR